ncbi:FAD-dependent thymidylate synthase [Paenibacillus cymbidii]|uniref:FAD-dependent thymidylate synthase n=1 Tax=Paenibacillus cymbidii TaxID=1639034 RepID=UPI0038B38253
MNTHYSKLESLSICKDQISYLLPLAAKCRSLHQMDLSEAAYIIELRSGSAGHFSYREIAYQMYERIVEKIPEFSKHIRVTNPRTFFNPFIR